MKHTAHLKRIGRLHVPTVAGLMAAAALAAPPTEPLPAPHFVFDGASPTIQGGHAGPGDVLRLAWPHPATALPGLRFGLLSPLDSVDGLSAGNANVGLHDSFMLLFSVDGATVGLAPPEPELVNLGVPYNVQDQAWRGQAAGDQFMSTEPYTRAGALPTLTRSTLFNNFLVRNNYDEGGTDFSALPETHAYTLVTTGVAQDNVCATAMLSLDGRSVAPVYFTLTAGSPALLHLPGHAAPSGAHLFVARDGPHAVGACCHAEGGCTLTPPFGCDDGVWLGPGSACDMCSLVAPVGACCDNQRECTLVTQFACVGGGARWLGPGADCAQCLAPPQAGACCRPDGFCYLSLPNACADGVFLGPHSGCHECGLPLPRACCFANGACVMLPPEECGWAGGVSIGHPRCLGDRDGDGQDDACAARLGDAPDSSACCLADGQCLILPAPYCVEQGGAPVHGGVCLGDANSNGVDDACEEPPPLPLAVQLYASFDELGLRQGDDIDGLVVFDLDENGLFGGNDLVLFSLAPGSPSLSLIAGASLSGAAADVFAALPGRPPTLFAAAGELGLGAGPDNMDALDLHLWSGDDLPATRFGIRAEPGDVNCDGIVSFRDIDPFVAALAGPAVHAAACPGCPWINADCNGDGAVNFRDIDAFVELLTAD